MVHEVNRPPVITTSSTSSINVSSSGCTDALSNIPDKNAAGEVGVPDTNLVSLLRPVLDGAPIILIGYRGAEPSIMEGIFAQNKEGWLDFPHGIHIRVHRDGETLRPCAESFARRLGTNFRLLKIDGFDELFADLGKELVGHDRYTAD